MLVLSRGENDRIVFPSLGISVEVLRVSGSRTSLGIDAPKSIRVVRHELLEEEQHAAMKAAHAQADATAAEQAKQRHEFRNQINRATLKLQLASKLFAKGEIELGLTHMTAGMAELSEISQSADNQRPSGPAEPLSLAEAKATFHNSNSGKLVLLVDDDDNERALMASYLQRCGIEVIEARDGLMAIYELSGVRQPDVILMDLNMPNLGGRETIEQIRKCSRVPDVPVFAVTAEPMDSSGITISAEGVSGWFQKPVQVDRIVDAIERCVTAS